MNNKQEKEGECDVWRDLATHQCCIRKVCHLTKLWKPLKMVWVVR